MWQALATCLICLRKKHVSPPLKDWYICPTIGCISLHPKNWPANQERKVAMFAHTKVAHLPPLLIERVTMYYIHTCSDKRCSTD